MWFGKKERSTLKIGKNRISSSIIVVIIMMTIVISIGSIYISYMEGRYDTIQKKEINYETDQVVKNIKKQIADNFYYLKYFFIEVAYAEISHRGIPCQGQDHWQVSGPRLQGHGQYGPCARPARQHAGH